jgi:hypothetical protein
MTQHHAGHMTTESQSQLPHRRENAALVC